MLDRFASEQMIGLTSECVIDMSRNIQDAHFCAKSPCSGAFAQVLCNQKCYGLSHHSVRPPMQASDGKAGVEFVSRILSSRRHSFSFAGSSDGGTHHLSVTSTHRIPLHEP